MKDLERQQRLFQRDENLRERMIAWIRRRMDDYNITMEALAESLEADANAVPQVLYRDAFGNTWDGHGDKPAWLARAIHAGQSIEHFRCEA
ncbi:H-NS histone family protein [Paraburkholderia sp. MMS20-SJTN17]|uniref:H-NS histone family protein n=1 Tax=Paraburkholderia translucens TaxID=2886945 RepID=A0ABS8KME3_9BURK|nr:H-NS family nucleoid-associated regulatory protein [Paraburkholderia sp. MMS20-SJTN17]MCC8405931.1 H-NS histone family protein [Paraburkholderia sp. MMS20-SJTN17]